MSSSRKVLRSWTWPFLMVLALVLAFGGTARAQTTAAKPPAKPKGPPKWTVEVHGGAGLGESPTRGHATNQFPVGAAFTTEAGLASRIVSSWLFGDGNALFGEVRAQAASVFNVHYPALAPLDGVLGAALARRKGGTGFGFRVSRRLSARYSAEFSFDRTSSQVGLNGGAEAAIEASRASFEAAFSALFAPLPQTGLRTTATTTVTAHDGRQTVLSGALRIALLSAGRFEAYALAGAASISTSEVDLDVRLRGNYQFRLVDVYAFNETDTVTLRFVEPSRIAAGLVGGGITFALSGRHGIRFDVRALVAPSKTGTSVEASPSLTVAGPVFYLPTSSSPGLQFSTTTGIRSSLSGGPTAALQTFTSDGLEVRVHVGVGYYVRF